MASKSQQIAALVAQLKAGAISKAQLFDELQRLKSAPEAGAEAPPSTAAPAHALAPEPAAASEAAPARDAPAAPPAPAPASAPVEAASGADAPARPPAPSDASVHSATLYEPAPPGRPRAASAASTGSLRRPVHSSTLVAQALEAAVAAPPPPPAPVEQPKPQQQPPAARRRPGPEHAGNGDSPTSQGAASSGRRSTGGGGGASPPLTAGTSQQPAVSSSSSPGGASPSATSPSGRRISPTQAHYRAILDSVPFPDRLRAWEEHKREEAARRAREAAARETAECTFRPSINSGSGGSAAAGGSGTSRRAGTPQQRSGGAPASGSSGSGSGSGGLGIHERLYLASTPASKGHQRQSLGGAGAQLQLLYAAASGAAVTDGGAAADGVPADGAGVSTPLPAGGIAATGGRRRASSFGGAGSARPGTAPAFLTNGRPLFTSPATGYPMDAPLSSRLPTAAEAAAYATRPLTKEEEELLRECTFKPAVNPTLDAKPVRSRYMDALASPAAAARDGGAAATAPTRRLSVGGTPLPLPSGLEHCTFKPKTNALKPSAMPAAALYVQAPIYERLARTQTAAQAAREAAVAASSSSAAPAGSPVSPAGAASSSSPTSPDGGAGSWRFSAPYSAARRAGSAGDATPGGTTAVSREERERAHAAFLARQEELLRRKEKTVATVAAATAPPLEPALCRKSLAMAAASGRESFLDRVTREGARKVADMKNAQARMGADPECTFAPAINPASKTLPGRTVNELSTGDLLRRESSQRLLKLRSEAEELEGVTFRPSINERSRGVPGRLRVLEDPDAYVARLAQEAAVASERAQRAAAHAAQKELEECTFKPVINDAPEYIHKIASSMALARAVKQAERAGGAPARPDWR